MVLFLPDVRSFPKVAFELKYFVLTPQIKNNLYSFGFHPNG